MPYFGEMRDVEEIPSFARDAVASVMIDEATLQAKVAEIGAAISRDYAGKQPLLVAVLKGGINFMADVLRQVTVPVTIDFIAISSYGPATQATGVVRILKDLDRSIQGSHVLVVEDIIDTGLTLNYILKVLRARKPASLEVATLLNKPVHRLANIELKYKGFDLPDLFVVGYGLDYKQRYRNLPFVCVLKPEVYR